MEVDRIVPVPPQRIRLDEVDEDEALVELLEELLGLLDAFDVGLRRMRFVDVAAGEDVLPTPWTVVPASRMSDR